MDWMLMVMDWIIEGGFNWFVDVDGLRLRIEKGDKRKEKVELWDRLVVVKNRWSGKWGDEFEDGEMVFVVRNEYGKMKYVKMEKKELMEVLKYGIFK